MNTWLDLPTATDLIEDISPTATLWLSSFIEIIFMIIGIAVAALLIRMIILFIIQKFGPTKNNNIESLPIGNKTYYLDRVYQHPQSGVTTVYTKKNY